MIRRSDERERLTAIVDGLHVIADALRAGESLRQALMRTAREPRSPFRGVAAALAAGRPLVLALHAESHAGHDADLASALCVLAVHADAGGDPLPAVKSLSDRLARRMTAREEAWALTTQARLGARAILLLTPIFLVLVSLSDPGGAIASLTQPGTRVVVLFGLVLQGVGALWIRTIVGGIGASRPVSNIPVLRAVRAMAAGRPRSPIDREVAETSETVALALDAGLSATAAITAVAPYASGTFGERIRVAVADRARPLSDAIAAVTEDLPSDAAQRFARAVASSADLGVPLAPSLRSLSDDIRERTSLSLTEDARKASIRVLVPLGVVVLPAFVLACLVPLFVGGLSAVAGH